MNDRLLNRVCGFGQVFEIFLSARGLPRQFPPDSRSSSGSACIHLAPDFAYASRLAAFHRLPHYVFNLISFLKLTKFLDALHY